MENITPENFESLIDALESISKAIWFLFWGKVIMKILNHFSPRVIDNIKIVNIKDLKKEIEEP